jgi:hypothetical protein
LAEEMQHLKKKINIKQSKPRKIREITQKKKKTNVATRISKRLA